MGEYFTPSFRIVVGGSGGEDGRVRVPEVMAELYRVLYKAWRGD